MPDPATSERPAALRAGLSALRHSAVVAFADFSVIYTWRTWTLGWLSRVLWQVAFFGLIGRLLGSPEQGRYLLVGNAVMIAAVESLFVVASTTWERQSGTLPLLVACPSPPALVFAGRSVQWLASGLATSLISLAGLGLAFGIPLSPARFAAAVPLVMLVSLATYAFGLTVAGVVLRVMEVRNVVSNVTGLVMMSVCGVQVPTTFWPGWVQAVASVLPVTHGLAGVRGVLAGAPAGEVLRDGALEAAVCAGWFAVAVLTFGRLAEHGRRDGSIEFGD